MGASGFTFSYCGWGVTSTQSGFSAYKGGAFTVIVAIKDTSCSGTEIGRLNNFNYIRKQNYLFSTGI